MTLPAGVQPFRHDAPFELIPAMPAGEPVAENAAVELIDLRLK